MLIRKTILVSHFYVYCLLITLSHSLFFSIAKIIPKTVIYFKSFYNYSPSTLPPTPFKYMKQRTFQVFPSFSISSSMKSLSTAPQSHTWGCQSFIQCHLSITFQNLFLGSFLVQTVACCVLQETDSETQRMHRGVYWARKFTK